MLLRQSNFNETESACPLLKENNLYLNKFPHEAWKESRSWAKHILSTNTNKSTNEESKSNNDDSKNDIFSHFDLNSNETIDGDNNNYGLRKIDRPDRIIVKDAGRTFLTEPKRQLLISLLTMIKSQLGDYQQTVSYVSGILLIFYDVETVFQMCYILGRSPFYAMKGYWRSDAVDQAIDGFVLWNLLKKRNNQLYSFLSSGDVPVTPETFVQKWFGGMGVQCIPVEFLLPLWTKFFQFGFRYLFKFYCNLIDCLTESLMECNNTGEIYEVVRLEKKQRYWKYCLNDYKNGKTIKIFQNTNNNDSGSDNSNSNDINKVTNQFGALNVANGNNSNQVFKINHFSTFGGNSNIHNDGKKLELNGFGPSQNSGNNSNTTVIELKPFSLLSERHQKMDAKNMEFGIALFFTKVFALTDANDDKNNFIDNLDFEYEREIAWKEYLQTRLTKAAVFNTYYAMKLDEQNADCEDQDCDFCDDGFGDFYCDECKKYLCDTCQEEPTGDHTSQHKVQRTEEMVNID